MTDKILIGKAVLNQALDALDFADEKTNELHIEFEGEDSRYAIFDDAITTLRASLSAPQPDQPKFAEWTSDYVHDNLHKLKAQPADISKIGCVNHDCDKCKAVQPTPSVDWQNIGALMDAHGKAKAAGLIGGTTSWGAFVAREMLKAAQPAEPVALKREPLCRDCADFGPICPLDGKPCDPDTQPAEPLTQLPQPDIGASDGMSGYTAEALMAYAASAVAAEREACALVAEQGFRYAKDGYTIADDIRARGEA